MTPPQFKILNMQRELRNNARYNRTISQYVKSNLFCDDLFANISTKLEKKKNCIQYLESLL